MGRVNVEDATGRLAGWFEFEDAQGRWPANGGSEGSRGGECLILTAGGKWVHEEWSYAATSRLVLVSQDFAKKWLLDNHYYDEVASRWGEPVPEEHWYPEAQPITVDEADAQSPPRTRTT